MRRVGPDAATSRTEYGLGNEGKHITQIDDGSHMSTFKGSISLKITLLTVLLFVLVVMAASDVSAKDGNRRGWTYGGGVSVSPLVAYTSTSVVRQERVSGDTLYYRYVPVDNRRYRFGVGMEAMVGYSWDEHNTIAVRQRQSFYDTDPWWAFATVTLEWEHYFGPPGRSVYSIMGVGRSTSINWSVPCRNGFGAAAVVGIGYEFAKHLSVWGVYQKGSFKPVDASQDLDMVTVGFGVETY